MGESIQRGLRSGANSDFRFGRYEMALHAFHQNLRRELERDTQ